MDRGDCEDIPAKVMWRPRWAKATLMTQFRERINARFDLALTNYHQLYKWSCENYSLFWQEYFKFSGVVSSVPALGVIDSDASIASIPKWFPGLRLNYAENLLAHCDDRVALYGASEGKGDNVSSYTFKEMRHRVSRYAASMKRMGVQMGDRVAGYLPNCPEAIFAMLATASIGAIWSSTSPDFGADGVLSRFQQIGPKLLFSVNGVVYNGKTHNHLGKVNNVLKNLDSVEHAVILAFVDEKFDISQVTKGCTLDDFLAFGSIAGDTPALEFEQVPFDHALFIMYSSGTTGAPKCMVHSVGGTLIQHMKEHQLHGNTTKNDVLMYYTTTGWMMWNWMVSALSLGCALVLYDGSPLIPSPATLWNLIDKLKVTIFGTGAKWLAVLEEKGVKPRLTHDLSSLHTILSTGSPLRPDSYDYVYSCIKPDVLLGSISGGTDIISCFMGQNSDLPVCQGEIQGANLGMAIEVWNELGESVEDERGELVCVKPFPCMPTHFWDDDQGFKYKKAYFAKYPGVWAHGDYCVLNSKTKGFVMLGRSDGTLNPNGVRFGSAEIYNIVEGISEIKDSLCVPQRKEDGEERIVLFVKMLESNQFDENLVKTVRTKIRLGLSARHVPAVIAEIGDIPYTLSGKKVEVAVRRIINGEKVLERGAFANPDSLDLYQNLSALENW